MNIYYLGPAGSFSEVVVKKYFSETNTFMSLDSFSEIVRKIEEDENGTGALVIENSISSSVHMAVDLMYSHTVSIAGEAFMKMQMDLMSNPGTGVSHITDVYSHVQALSQCSKFISINKFNIHEMKSTSDAAQYVKNSHDNSKAAIGSRYLAELMNLDIIEKDVANEKHNLSRWIFIKKKMSPSAEKINKLTYIFKVKHEPGSLVKVLNAISAKKGNLTKIESRPLPGTDWEYGFWIDIEIPENTHEVFHEVLKNETLQFRIVGEYQKGKLIV